jgi:flavodoxin
VLIFYGTEYGFSEELAKKMQAEIHELPESKYYPRIVDMEVNHTLAIS